MIIHFSPNSSPALSLENPWQGQHHGRYQFPLFSSCWSDEPDMACFHRSSPQLLPFNAYSKFNPTLLRFDLGKNQIAQITGGGGLFDLHSRACKVKKVSWVRKVQESRNNRRGTWRKTLDFVRMKPRHGQPLKCYFPKRTGVRCRGCTCLKMVIKTLKNSEPHKYPPWVQWGPFKVFKEINLFLNLLFVSPLELESRKKAERFCNQPLDKRSIIM